MKNAKGLLSIAAALVLIGAGCAAGGANEATDTVEGESAAVESVKVGLMLPLSGDAASYGTSVQRGVELALQEMEADHIELVTQDSRCEAKEAVNAVNQLVNSEQVVAIIGELCSGATLAAAPVAEEAAVVMVSPASTAPTVTEAGDFVFRTIASDARQGDFAARYVAEQGLSKLAVIAINDDYGQGFDSVLRDVFPQVGGEVVASEFFQKGDADMRTQLTKIKAANPDSLYIISNSPDAAVAILRQVKELDVDVAVYGSEGLKSDDILAGAKEAAEGLRVSVPTEASQAFADAHMEAYGEAPGPFSAQAYDAITAISNAVKDGAASGEAIRDALYDMTFDGVTGSIDFDENGDVAGEYEVLEVKDGAFAAL